MKNHYRNSHWPLMALFVTPLALGAALAMPGAPMGGHGPKDGGPGAHRPPAPNGTPRVCPTHDPSATPQPRPTREPRPTPNPKATPQPRPTCEPRPTPNPSPTHVPRPTPVPQATPVPVPTTAPTPRATVRPYS